MIFLWNGFVIGLRKRLLVMILLVNLVLFGVLRKVLGLLLLVYFLIRFAMLNSGLKVGRKMLILMRLLGRGIFLMCGGLLLRRLLLFGLLMSVLKW